MIADETAVETCPPNTGELVNTTGGKLAKDALELLLEKDRCVIISYLNS